MKDRVSVTEGPSAESYWRRFWHLQQEEWVMWKKGVVDKNFYQMWLNYRRREWKEDAMQAGKKYRLAFEGMKKDLNPGFYEYMMGVFGENTPGKNEAE